MSTRITRISKFVAVLGTAALLLSGCNREYYNATLKADGTIAGTVTNFITPERFMTLDAGTQNVVPVTNVTGTYDAGDCSYNDVTVTVSLPLTTSVGENFVAYNMHFTNFDHTFGAGVGMMSDQNVFHIGNYSLVNGTCLGDPGPYISGGQAFVGPDFPSGLGWQRSDWDNYQREIAYRNISIMDRPYWWALQEIRDQDADAEFSDIQNFFSAPEFASLATRQWAPGEFVTGLHELGIQTKRTEEGWGVIVPISHVPLTHLDDDSGTFSSILPKFAVDSDGKWNLTLNYAPYIDGKAEGVDTDRNYPTDLTQTSAQLDKAAKDAAVLHHVFKVEGVVYRTNGVFNAKANTVTFDWKGWGTHSTQTTIAPVMQVLNGYKVNFVGASSALSARAKNYLKSAKTTLKAFPSIRIFVIKDARVTGSSKIKAQNKLLKKRADAVKSYLVTLGVTTAVTISYLPTEANNSSVTKAAVNNVVVSSSYGG
jgi:outer membrane protein OmpA-like peptidoglycan-associated protein